MSCYILALVICSIMVHISVIRGFPIISIITNNQTHLTLNIGCCNTETDQPGGGGGGGGGYVGGRIRSLSKLKDTPKAQISGQKSKCRQQTQKPSHFRSHSAYFLDCRVILTPILCTWVQKSTLLLQNRGHAEVLKIDPFFREIRKAGGAPICT